MQNAYLHSETLLKKLLIVDKDKKMPKAIIA